MTGTKQFRRVACRTALMTLAFVAALLFGIILLIDGDWVPGTIIVVGALVGLAVQIPVIRKLCRAGAVPTPPHARPGS